MQIISEKISKLSQKMNTPNNIENKDRKKENHQNPVRKKNLKSKSCYK